jgi:hypothetical protein
MAATNKEFINILINHGVLIVSKLLKVGFLGNSRGGAVNCSFGGLNAVEIIHTIGSNIQIEKIIITK